MIEEQVSQEWLGIDLEGTLGSTERAVEAVSGLIEGAEDRRDVLAPGLTWSVQELATHLAAGGRLYGGYIAGQQDFGYDITDLAGSNRRQLDAFGEHTLSALASSIRTTYAELVETARGRDPFEDVPWHGTVAPLGAVCGLLLGELLLHGIDLAKALGVPWKLDESDAVHVVRAGYVTAPRVVDHQLAATKPVTYRVQLPSVPAAIWKFDHEGLTIRPWTRGDRIDCTIRTDAASFLLVAYGRTSPIRSALRGRVLAWGRRPLAGFRMSDYLLLG